ncbi:MAG: hypothetical protein OJF50_006416 [Nitrospira sp.]|nr:hypothetical protein [Nitrospira sp.]
MSHLRGQKEQSSAFSTLSAQRVTGETSGNTSMAVSEADRS